MSKGIVVRRAVKSDTHAVDSLLFEWLRFKPASGRLDSILRAISNRELLVADVGDMVVGFIHYAIHEDIIDGDPNSFITAFYVTPPFQRRGVGTILLNGAIRDSLKRGAVGVETSTIHADAKKLYERLHFKQTQGDIGEVFLELDVTEFLLHIRESERSSREQSRETHSQ